MVCKKCGRALPSEGFVCKNCGVLMTEEQIKEQKEYMKENNTKYKTKFIGEEYNNGKLFESRDNSSNKLMGLLVVGGVLLIIIIIAILVYLS